MTRTGAQQFNLNKDPIGIASMINPPVTTSYTPFLHNLEYIVDLTANVINGFYAMYARGERGAQAFTPEQRSLISAQSGGSNSYAMRNKELLQRLVNRYSEVVKFR